MGRGPMADGGRFLYSAEIVVQATEGGEAQVLAPGMSEPLTLKPGEQIRFKPSLSLQTDRREAGDWNVPLGDRMDRWREHLGEDFGGRPPEEYA